jgi:hypothetical protein
MPKQEKHADPNTLLGQLQRGRGEGYRQALAAPRSEAWGCLLDCICNDPRLDSQVESRADYYAQLAIETGLDLDPLVRYVREHDDKGQGWNTPLAVETLGELAKRDYKDSAARLCYYVRWGQWWEWILEDLTAGKDSIQLTKVASIIEERFPGDAELENALAWLDLDLEPWATLTRFSARVRKLKDGPRKISGTSSEPELPANAASFTADQLLQLANKTNYWKLAKLIRQAAKPSDLDLLVKSVSLENPFVANVALAGLAQLAPPTTFEWLKDFWSSNPGMPGFLRRRAGEVIISLPPELTMPMARERLHHPEWHERYLAEDLFEAHAAPEDIPVLRDAIRKALLDDEKNCYRLCNLVEAFLNIPGIGSIPELSDVFVQFRYSYGRARAAEAIKVTAPDLFREQFATECLWDCEARTRRLALETAPGEEAGVADRFQRLADDEWEDEEVRAEAKRRAQQRD